MDKMKKEKYIQLAFTLFAYTAICVGIAFFPRWPGLGMIIIALSIGLLFLYNKRLGPKRNAPVLTNNKTLQRLGIVIFVAAIIVALDQMQIIQIGK